MLLQVHDELVFDVHNSELEKIQPMIKHEMENKSSVRCRNCWVKLVGSALGKWSVFSSSWQSISLSFRRKHDEIKLYKMY